MSYDRGRPRVYGVNICPKNKKDKLRMRDAAMDSALEASISRERLAKYLDASNGELAAAITLYERNMVLSEAFYVPLQGLEACPRNKLHQEMTRLYGEEWLTDHATASWGDGFRCARCSRSRRTVFRERCFVRRCHLRCGVHHGRCFTRSDSASPGAHCRQTWGSKSVTSR